ncbi:MAG: MFS transporter [Candidatus Hodarchaeota archaeon]
METLQATKLYYLMGVLAPSTADAFLVGFYTIYLLRYLTLTEIGLQYAFWLLILALADFPTGSLADFWGARNCLLLSYSLMIGGYLGLLLVGSLVTVLLPLFFAIHFFFATSAAQESGTLAAWFTNQWKANHEDMNRIREVYGKFSAYNLLAKTSAAILGGFFTAYLAVEWVFLGAIAYCSLGALAATQLSTRNIALDTSARAYVSQTRQALAILHQDPRLILLIAIGSLNYAGWFVVTYLALQPILYQDLEAVTIGEKSLLTITLEPLFLLALLGATFSVANILGYHWGGRIQSVRDISAACLLFVPIPCMYLLLFGTQAVASATQGGGRLISPLVITILGILLITLTTGLYNPHMKQFYQRLLPDEHRAGILSLRSTAGTATTILFTLMGGAMLQKQGLIVGFLLAGAFGFAALALLGIVRYLSPEEPPLDIAPRKRRSVITRECGGSIPTG